MTVLWQLIKRSIFIFAHMNATTMASASSTPAESLASALSKTRRLTTSSLLHQSKPAQLLVAIESTISSTLGVSTRPHSATEYFVSLLQCLEKVCTDDVDKSAETMGQGALLPATLYLLAIVVPETPSQVVLSKISPFLDSLLPLYEAARGHPSALRSLLQINSSIVLISTASLLNSSSQLKRAWSYLLEFSLDPRPKVRHFAQEGVRKILCTPVPPKLSTGSHPYLSGAREWVTRELETEAKTGGESSHRKKTRFADGEDPEGKRAIWILQGLRGWVAIWGDEVSCSRLKGGLDNGNLHVAPRIAMLLVALTSTFASSDRPNILSPGVHFDSTTSWDLHSYAIRP